MKPLAEMESNQSKRDLRRSERRNLILDVAQDSFLENGYSATTMSAIAARLGGSKGTLWSHFSSKESLFTAVLDRRADQFRLELMEILNPDSRLETTILAFCRQYIALLCLPTVIATHRLVIGEAKRFPELGKMFFDHAIGVTRGILTDFITKATRRWSLEVSDPAAAASLLTSLCHGRCFQQSLFGLVEGISSEDIARDADLALAAFMKLFAGKGSDQASLG